MIEPFKTRAEMTAAIRDKRYGKDVAYEHSVRERIAITDFTAVTGALINQQHPQSNGLSDMDQVNPDMPMGYQTIADFTKAMRSERYKTDPAFRLAIEGGLIQATPNWNPRTDSETRQIQLKGEVTGSEQPKPRLESMFDQDGKGGLSMGGGK